MRFDLSERIETQCEPHVVTSVIYEQFEAISEEVEWQNEALVVKSVASTFGAINRVDTTYVQCIEAEDGWLIVSRTEMRPSFMFWVFVILGLFAYGVGWLIPVGLYIVQRNAAKSAIRDVLDLSSNLLRRSKIVDTRSRLDTEQFERLANLKNAGVLSDEEFVAAKAKLLN